MDKGQLTGMVFLDLSKAFDTIDHDIMLKKLISLGFSDSAALWFKAYLTNRSQSVQFVVQFGTVVVRPTVTT